MRTQVQMTKWFSALALLVLAGASGVLRAQAPTVTSEQPTAIPQTNAVTLGQPPPYTAHFAGTGFLPTTTASFSWAGGTGAGTVYYGSASSIQVRLPNNISPTATTVTPTLCNGTACVQATDINLTPLTPTTGTLSANPNPATVGQPTVLSAVFTPNLIDIPPTGAPSGRVNLSVNGTITGYYSLTLDQTNSSLTQAGTATLSTAPYVTPLIADFNGDGVPDMIFYDGNIPAQIHVALGGAPAGYFQNEILYPIPAGCSYMSSLAVGDFNKDGFSDYVVDCQDDDGVTTVDVYLSNGDGTFAAPIPVSNAYGTTVVVGDFNKDGTPDLLLTGALTNGVCANVCPTGFAVFTGNGDGTFTASTTSSIANVFDESTFLVMDVDGDGYPDIVGLNNSGGESSTIDIFQNNANASYGTTASGGNTPTYSIPLNSNPYFYYSLVTGDFNLDGHPDLAVAYGEDSAPAGYGVVTILNTSTSGQISYAAPVAFPQTSNVNNLSAGDVNGDQYTDLAFTTQCVTNCQGSGNNLNVLVSDGKGNLVNNYPNLTLNVPAGTVNSVIVADLNHDGYADMIVLDTPTVSSTTQPVTGYITSGAGDATITYYPQIAGNEALTETYNGDLNFTGTTVNLSLPVNGASDTVSVGSTVSTPVYGQPIMLSSTVTSTTAGTPTGVITFFDGTASLGAVPMTGGSASLMLSSLTVGLHQITASYSGDGTYAANTSSNFAGVTVSQATPVVTWNPVPANITYGTPLVAGQLDATAATTYVASVPGTFQYSSNAGAVLGAGTQTLTVTFTPTDTTDYVRASGSAKIVVSQATPTITWNAPAAIVIGTPLSATQLNATASFGTLGTVAGSFNYTPAAGTVLGAGNNQALSLQFSPADATDYTTASGSTTINVIPLVIGQLAPASVTIGAAATPVTVTGTGFLPNSVVNINGTPVATSYISATNLSIVIPAANLLTAQTLSLTVTDPTQVQTSAATSFNVLAPPAQATFTGPTTIAPAQQPTVNFTLTTGYPVPIAGTVTLTFAGIGGVDDPSIQFATGGRTQTFTIPANTTTTPTIAFQSGTDAGTITVTLTLSAGGQIITPASVVPLAITVPTAAPVITSFILTRSGDTLTANIIGYSNTRDLSQATFNFTAASGSSVSDPQVVVPATALFTAWFSNATSQQYGSSFLYTQQFNLNDNASTIGSVTVTLTNSVGASATATAQ